MSELSQAARGHRRSSWTRLLTLATAGAMVAGMSFSAPVAAVAVGRQAQTISFTPPYDGAVGDQLALVATASSGLAVTYLLADTTACTLDGAALSFVGVGSCHVTASQSGDDTWAPATDVSFTIESLPGYVAGWSIKKPDGSDRVDGTIKVGDQLAIAIAAVDSTPVASCLFRITSAGGWLMQSPGVLHDGLCAVSFTLPAYTDPAARFGDRVNDDLCISMLGLTFADAQPRAMTADLRTSPGGVSCYNGGDRGGREDRVLDFQVSGGGTPQPFASVPDMVSWNPADWVGYTGLEFGQTAHLELPSFATTCSIYLNGSSDTVIMPATGSGCDPWEVRLPGVLPSTLPDEGLPGDWQVEVVAGYSTSLGQGEAIGYVNMPYSASDGVFQSSEPAIFPTDLATTRFVTVGDTWTPSFAVSGATPSDCQLDVITVHPGLILTDSWYDASPIGPDGTCHFTVPALTSENEYHQFYVYSNTDAGRVVFGGTINAIPAPAPPTISDPTTNANTTAITVTAGSGDGLLVDMSVTAGASSSVVSGAGTSGAKPGVAVSSLCSGKSVSTNLSGGGSIPKLAAACHLAPGTYTATAHMYDAAGKITTSTRQFTVPAIARYSGSSQFATAAAVSANTFGSPCHCTAYIAYASNFPDALAGAAAAGSVQGPVLFVATTGAINAATAAELTRLKPDHIVVLGSTGVISSTVFNALATYAPAGQTKRYWGADRYGTAASVSANTFGANCGCTVYVAYSMNFPDALAGAAATGAVPGPVLLVGTTGTINANTRAELTRLHPAHIVVLGSTGVISAAVFNDLATYAPPGQISRYWGQDRYGTAASISSHTFAANCGCVVYVSAGTDFNGALAAAAAAGTINGPLLLVANTGALPPATVAELQRLKPVRIVVVGTGISATVYNLLAAYASPH